MLKLILTVIEVLLIAGVALGIVLAIVAAILEAVHSLGDRVDETGFAKARDLWGKPTA